MPRHPVPTGAERQALFDELSATFARCREQASAIEAERDTALERIADAQKLLVKRDLAVRDAERKSANTEHRAERVRAASVEAADREFFETAQAADAKRQQAGIDLDAQREIAIQDANDLFEQTVRAIHQATAGLQAIADAERRAREERNEAIGKAERRFRDDIRAADRARQQALDTALTRQIAAHAAAEELRSRTVADARTELSDAITQAERALNDALIAIPGATVIVDEAQRQLEALERRCDAQKRAIEARLRGEE
jgi:hypothetical protein